MMSMDEEEFSLNYKLEGIRLVQVNLTAREEQAIKNIQSAVDNMEYASGWSWQTIVIVALLVLVLVILAVIILAYQFYTRVFIPLKMVGLEAKKTDLEAFGRA